MKCKVTKKMAATLNRAARKQRFDFTFDYREAAPETYDRFVSNVWEAYDWGDFDAAKSKMKYIAVVYPPEYYAPPRYITTKDLNACCSPGMTIDDFTAEIFRAVEI